MNKKYVIGLLAMGLSLVSANSYAAGCSVPPTCSAGQALSWNGTAFTCVSTKPTLQQITATIGSCMGLYPNESGCAPWPNGNGANGGTATASCPAGYSLIHYGLSSYLTTSNGISGWNNGGTVSCANVGGNLRVSLTNFTGGSPQVSVSCSGLCMRN